MKNNRVIVNSIYPEWFVDAFNYFEPLFKDNLNNNLEKKFISKYISQSLFPGRRIRPSLYCSFFRDYKQYFPEEKDLIPAIAIEIFHSAAIIVDDIVDNEPIRRNKNSFNSIVGTNSAIIFSHYLISLGYRILSGGNDTEISKEWNLRYSEASIGELYDIGQINNMDALIRCQKSLEKTTAFFKFIGFCLEKRLSLNEQIEDLFMILGRNFQISNDIFDFYYYYKMNRTVDSKKVFLNFSHMNGLLINTNIMDSSYVGTIISESHHKSFIQKAITKIGSAETLIGTYVLEAKNEINKLTISNSAKIMSYDFLDALTIYEFWSHYHED